MKPISYILIGLIIALLAWGISLKVKNKQLESKELQRQLQEEQLIVRYFEKKGELDILKDSLTARFQEIQIENDSLDEELRISQKRIFNLNKWHEQKYRSMDTATVQQLLDEFKNQFYKD